MTTTDQAGDVFQKRHIGPDTNELQAMLQTIQSQSLDALMAETLPEAIRNKHPLATGAPLSERDFFIALRKVAKKNQTYKSYIGLGYHHCVTPSVIQRNILENPGWYTQYTPYQAEISQGRLEALLNFQTMVSDLTGMEIANASLLDEGTAAAEAMSMLFRVRNKRSKKTAETFFVSENCLPQTMDILKTRAEPLGIVLKIGNFQDFTMDDTCFGALLQYPTEDGQIHDYCQFIEKAHACDALVAVAADLLSLTLLTPPGDFGADVVLGAAQRLGVPLGYGGPHAAYFSTKAEYVRHVPGRIIGVSKDSHGNTAYRMALQTREQHIKRERATSNICTAQALLAIMAGMYAVYHGPHGMKAIAQKIHGSAKVLENALKAEGYQQLNTLYFDTLKIRVDGDSQRSMAQIKSTALSYEINFRYLDDQTLGISLDETTTVDDLKNILSIFAPHTEPEFDAQTIEEAAQNGISPFSEALTRTSSYLTHPIFNSYHSETKMMRYIKSLENKDISLTFSMIPLGSCTMKLNSATEMMPLSWPEFSTIHPFVPKDQAQGYAHVIQELEKDLCEITGFAGVSLQPNSGAQGEYAGLMMIRAYHQDCGEPHRTTILIPSSAHGTNPASASMAGMEVVVVKCDDQGNIDVDDLRKKVDKHQENLAGLMITYPSTHGVFEEAVQEVCDIIHKHGGQVYMDGANMNAQVGLTNPALIGADVCHLNLHKTFSIPHGGGGPGMGPICVAKHLCPYLPGHPVVKVGGDKAISAISATPWGSSSILLISYAYIKLLGTQGVTDSTKYAILNANYIKTRLELHYPILFTGKNGRVAHEMILDLRDFKKTAKIEVEDVAKRLMDYGFHSPTQSFPVPGTLMVEPTESESQDELDRFCDAMIAIRQEIREIEDGTADPKDNVLKNAPHTAQAVMTDDWSHPYSREKAVYPVPYLRTNKFWTSVGRIDNSYGDRNLMCSCPSMEAYTETD